MQTPKDTSRILLLVQLAGNYRFFNPDSSIIIAQQAIDLAQMIHFDKGKVRALINYGEARRFQGEFPQSLEAQLRSLVYDANSEGEARKFFLPANKLRTAFLFIPGILGWLLHAPLFYTCRLVTASRFKNSDHYDGVLTALLFFSYPFYVLLLALLSGSQNLIFGALVFLALPLLAWCWMQVKHLFE